MILTNYLLLTLIDYFIFFLPEETVIFMDYLEFMVDFIHQSQSSILQTVKILPKFHTIYCIN